MVNTERHKLKRIINKGIQSYKLEKEKYGSSVLLDCIMKEIDLECVFGGMEVKHKEIN